MIQKLLDRRVPQLAGLYVLASWGFVQFVDWAVDQYALSPMLTNFAVTLLLVLLPGVVMLAWRHGAPGRDGWTKVDAAVIGLNLVAAAAILNLAFSGQELGAATTIQLIEDEDGNTVERVLPKAEFRRDVLVWDFDNESGDPDLDWLQAGITIGINMDLVQDVFVTALDANDPRVREPIEEAGFQEPVGLPLALKRKAAERLGLGHFLEGDFSREGDTLVVQTRLYETRNARQVGAHTYRGMDPLEIADRISVELRRDMGVPEWQIDESVDLPAAEILSESPEALRAISEGTQLFRTNDLAASREKMQDAVAFDSTCAACMLGVGQVSMLMGDQQTAGESFAGATRYAYRLPERIQLSVRVIEQLMVQGDPDGALRTARYWTEIYPQDVDGRRILAVIYALRGDRAGQIAQYQALLAIDSLDVESMANLAAVFRGQQQYDSALVYFARLRDLQPGDVDTHLNIAVTQTRLLNFDEARGELERARTAAPNDADVLNQIARLDMRQGRNEDAARRVEEVNALARTPQQVYAAAGLEESLYYAAGQFGRLEAAYRRRLAAGLEHLPPVQIVTGMPNSELLIYAADGGRARFALSQLDSLAASVQEPWSSTTAFTAVRIHLDVGDVESARQSLDRMRTVIDAQGTATGRLARIAQTEGRIAWLEDGDCARALAHFDEANEMVPGGTLYVAWQARCLTDLERWAEAEEAVIWLLARFPGAAKFRLDAARLYAAQGRTDDAIAEVEAALVIWSEADADFTPAIEARALLEELRG